MHILPGRVGRDSLGEQAMRELDLARREIRQGRFQRSMALMTAFGAVVSGFEAYTQHQRGAFDDWLMWTPVWLMPPLVGAAGVTMIRPRYSRFLLPALSAATIADGLAGFVLHLRGIARLPGGFRLGQYNVVIGPPIFAPLLVGGVGVLGLLASVLRPESLSLPPESRPRLAAASWRARAQIARATPAARLERRISHGRFQQAMALMTGTMALLSGGEAYFEHLRGSYNQRWMWTPVWLSAPVLAASVGAVRSRQIATRVLPVTAAATFLDGMIGLALHLRGLSRMPGRWGNIGFNITMGPPLFAPLLFCLVGLLGLIGALLRRKEAV